VTTVSVAVGGVAVTDVNFVWPGCAQWSSEPVPGPDGTWSVDVRMFRVSDDCVVDGLVVVDGAGNEVAQQLGGASGYEGVVTVYGYLPSDIARASAPTASRCPTRAGSSPSGVCAAGPAGNRPSP